MQLKSFHWLSHHDMWAIIPCSTNMVSKRVIFGALLFLVKSIFYILGAFLIKQLFHSRLLDMRLVIANSALRASLAIYLVQSLNSPFFPPHMDRGWTRAGERRVQDNLHAHAQNEPIKNYWSQPRCSRQSVAQCLFQLALWKKTFSLTLILS